MRKLLIATAALLLTVPALAADLPPLKALPRAPLRATCPVGTGFYAGINTYAQMANGTSSASIAPGTTVNVNTLSDGAAVGLTAGYAWGDCATGRFFAFEGMFDYQNLTGSGGVSVTAPGGTMTVGAATSSKYEFTQKLKIGANLSDVMTFLPNFGTVFPGFPTPASGTNNPKAYVAGVVRESGVTGLVNIAGATASSGQTWAVEPGIGVGIQSATANGSVVDVFFDYTFKGGGFTVGAVQGLPGSAATANLGGVARAGLGIYW